MHRLTEFAIGLLFGLGLILAGMTDPGKVIGFLDLAGTWDPSLALVMGGAIAVGVGAFAVARRRTVAFLGGAMHLPSASAIAAIPGRVSVALRMASPEKTKRMFSTTAPLAINPAVR
jgi:uncharacterized membrane protein YedE/YeeE